MLEAIFETVKQASLNELKGIVGIETDPVVSQDFVSDTRTSILDTTASIALNTTFFKLVAWYDNEYGYANKLVELASYSASLD